MSCLPVFCQKKKMQISPSDVIRALSYPGFQRGSFENEAPKTRNHCRLNNCNFTSSMGEAPREKNNVLSPSWEPYQTVSAVYFILGILRTDLWSQSSADLSPVRKKKSHKALWNKNRQKAFSFPGGESGCRHSGYQACPWPLRDIASHVRIYFWTKGLKALWVD